MMMRSLRLGLVAVMLVVSTGCMPGGGGTMKVTALLKDSAGVFVGNDVGVLGVSVGKIVSIEPNGSNVKVTMEIDKDVSVPATAGAVVVARSVATDRYVELTPVYKSGPKMTDGAAIGIDRTKTPVDFDQVLASLNEFATGLAGNGASREAVRRALAVQSKALAGKGSLVNRTIHSLSDAVNGISAQRENITSTLTSLDTLTTTIAANQQTTRRFIQQVSKASQILAEERGNFQAAMRSLSAAVEVVADFAKSNRAEIVKTMNNTSGVLENLLTKRTQLAEVLEVFPVVLQNLQRAYSNGRIAVRVSPTVVLPLGNFLNQICSSLPLNLCDNLGSDPLGLITALEKLLGGVKP